MKRLLDLLIILVFLALIGAGGYVAYLRVPEVQDRVDELLNRSSPAEEALPDAARVTEAGVELPRLRQADLAGLLPEAGDLPPGYGMVETTDPYVMDLDVTQQQTQNSWPAAATRLAQIRQNFGWDTGAGVLYNTCALNRDTSELRIEVSQLRSTQAARDFIDDPLVRGYFRALSFARSDLANVHGFYLISRGPAEGTCYAREWLHYLFFEQYGLLFALQTRTNAAAPITVGRTLLESLVAPLAARVRNLEALAEVTVPPTPVPVIDPLNVLTRNVTLESLQLLLPTAGGLNLSVAYSPDLDEGARYDLPGLVAFYRSFNTDPLNALAQAIDVAGRRYGLIGQQIVVWKPSRECPSDGPNRVEVDLALFERAAGATAYLQDQNVQAARRGTGLFSEFVASGDAVYGYGNVSGGVCGPLLLVEKSQTYERLLFSISFTISAAMSRESATAIVDAMMEKTLIDLYMQRLK